MSSDTPIAELPGKLTNGIVEDVTEQLFDTERFDAVPEHGGSLQSLIERYGDNPGNCPYIKSMGAAGLELVQRLAIAETKPDRGPTVRELLEAAKKNREETSKEIVEKPKFHRAVLGTDAPAAVLVAGEKLASQDHAEPQTSTTNRKPVDKLLANGTSFTPSNRALLEEAERIITDTLVEIKTKPNLAISSDEDEKVPEPIWQKLIETKEISISTDLITPTTRSTQTENYHAQTIARYNIKPKPILGSDQAVAEDIALERLEDRSPTDDLLADTFGPIGTELGADILFTEIEETTPPRITFIEELLVDEPPSFIEVDDTFDHGEQSEPEISKDSTLPSDTIALTGTEGVLPQDLNELIDRHFPSLEPNRIEVARPIIEAVMLAVREAQLTPTTVNETVAPIQQQLEELCIELFECLNIDYNEETIKQFMQSITADESGLAVSGKPVEETLTIEDLNQMGTHEHKPFFDASSMSDVAQLIKHKIRPQYLLGKYALLIGAV